MATTKSYYKANRANFTERTAGNTLPAISTKLDSVRAYQFEVRFYNIPGAEDSSLTLAAKQISPIGFTVEDIVVDRLNDKVFYPGKASPEEVTMTFDNLLLKNTTPALWNWFRTVYNPLSGGLVEDAELARAGFSTFKALKVTILQMDNNREPKGYVELYGVYPKSFKLAEHNYSTNEFHTIDVSFRYDFMNLYRK